MVTVRASYSRVALKKVSVTEVASIIVPTQFV